MQLWPGKSPERLYAEVIEQVVHADRLGYDAYAIIEHFSSRKFSISPDPLALFAQRRAADAADPLPHDAARAAVPQPGGAGLADRGRARSCSTGATSSASGAATAGSRRRRASGSRTSRELYEESLRDLLQGARERALLARRPLLQDPRLAHRAAAAARRPRIFVGGTSDSTYELAGERGWAVAVPPLLPYEALRGQLDIYRASCAEHGNEPDIVWIHACYMDDDRDDRQARRRAGDAPVPRGQRLAADRARPRPRSCRRPATASTPRASWSSSPRRRMRR